jgi:hypothetical protein
VNFYETNLAKFPVTTFNSSTHSNVAAYDALVTCKNNSIERQMLLQNATVENGGTPVESCSYNWTWITNSSNFLTQAGMLENTTVSIFASTIAYVQYVYTLELQ